MEQRPPHIPRMPPYNSMLERRCLAVSMTRRQRPMTVASATGFPVVTVPDTQFKIKVDKRGHVGHPRERARQYPVDRRPGWTAPRPPRFRRRHRDVLCAQATILKQSSDTFRVNDPEPQDPGTTRPQFYDQTNPQVAMDLDGNFVITWQSVVPDSVTPAAAPTSLRGGSRRPAGPTIRTGTSCSLPPDRRPCRASSS